MEIDVNKLLYTFCEDDRVYDDNYDLIENGILDSFAIISLFTYLEDIGIEIQITRIDRNRLRTAASIKELIAEAEGK
jgi:acyl carrier protein